MFNVRGHVHVQVQVLCLFFPFNRPFSDLPRLPFLMRIGKRADFASCLRLGGTLSDWIGSADTRFGDLCINRRRRFSFSRSRITHGDCIKVARTSCSSATPTTLFLVSVCWKYTDWSAIGFLTPTVDGRRGIRQKKSRFGFKRLLSLSETRVNACVFSSSPTAFLSPYPYDEVGETSELVDSNVPSDRLCKRQSVVHTDWLKLFLLVPGLPKSRERDADFQVHCR